MYYFQFSDGAAASSEVTVGNNTIDVVPEKIVPTTEVVSLAPLALFDKFTQHAFVAHAAPAGRLYATPFTLNASRFIPLGGNLCIAMD